MEVIQAIIAPRTLHQLCQVALETASNGDLQALPCAALLSTLLSAGATLTHFQAHAQYSSSRAAQSLQPT